VSWRPGTKNLAEAIDEGMPLLVGAEEGGGLDAFQEIHLHVPFCPPVLAPEPGPGLPGLPPPRPSLGPLAPIGGPVPSCLGIGTSFLVFDVGYCPLSEPPGDARDGQCQEPLRGSNSFNDDLGDDGGKDDGDGGPGDGPE